MLGKKFYLHLELAPCFINKFNYTRCIYTIFTFCCSTTLSTDKMMKMLLFVVLVTVEMWTEHVNASES